jgi:hypothetical protein
MADGHCRWSLQMADHVEHSTTGEYQQLSADSTTKFQIPTAAETAK